MTLEQFNIHIREFRKANPCLSVQLETRNEDREVLVNIANDVGENLAVIIMEFFAEDMFGKLELTVNYLSHYKERLETAGERIAIDALVKDLENDSH